MEYSKIKYNKMPEHHTVGWFEILTFAQNVTPWFVLGGVLWRLIDRVIKYFNDGREAKMNALIDAKISPLTQAIKDLTEAVYEIRHR